MIRKKGRCCRGEDQNHESERSREITREVREILDVPPLELPQLKPSEPSEN